MFTTEFFGQSARTVLEHENPLGFIRTGTLHLNYPPKFNMQAMFTYTPLKLTAAVCKGRKRLVVSRQSRLEQKHSKTLASLEPLDQISRCYSKLTSSTTLQT